MRDAKESVFFPPERHGKGHKETAMLYALRLWWRCRPYFHKSHIFRRAQRKYAGIDPVVGDVIMLDAGIVSGVLFFAGIFALLRYSAADAFPWCLGFGMGGVILLAVCDVVTQGDSKYSFKEGMRVLGDAVFPFDESEGVFIRAYERGNTCGVYTARAQRFLTSLAGDLERAQNDSHRGFPYDADAEELRVKFKKTYWAFVGLGVISDTGWRPYFEKTKSES